MDAGRGRTQALALMRGFRLTLVGLAIVSVALAWLWQSGTLLGLALVIAGEELLESSVVIAALAGKGLRAPRCRCERCRASAARRTIALGGRLRESHRESIGRASRLPAGA